MKRYLLSGLTIVLSTLALASAANAGQTHLNDAAADINGDGVVTISELIMYNRDQRD
ncbi:hypothetical protein IQ273_19020 [Nodosilinea sp. LEGE 07298]|uniref:hypothetical protein n=1 Tax=Nodosilinea sp. LEGE 07298 TaxID=2777970 RepID=UPI001881B576|nr:hypothetical protein [Nodosilinea sp. LEGE 07298]MBE9111500.1 hypothetical protein [Nodosilinea sp. LEGE 07298]